MRLLLSVEHPAWVHQFRYVINGLKQKGHEIKVVAIRKDVTCDLLEAFDIPYEIISESSGKGIIEKGLIFFKTTFRIFKTSRKFQPDLFFGRASPMIAINSFIFNKPHIIFEDTENASFSLNICKICSDIIITPACFEKYLGKKQLRVNAYKELFYLHPNYFYANPKILQDLRIKENEKIIVVRFVAWNAHHDIGHSGLTNETKRKALAELEKFGRVLISSEGPLPPELEKYRISISAEKMHDLLNYATLLYGESSTMASECAILGIHSIFCDYIGRGYTNEEETRYGLVYNFKLDTISQNKSIQKAIDLLQMKDLQKIGKEKKKILLSEKIDISKFMIWLIDNYPNSYQTIKNDYYFQNNFDEIIV